MFYIESLFLSSFINTIPLNTAQLNTARLHANKLSCISVSNQPFKARPEIVNVNSSNPIFYPFSVKTSKCSSNCNYINDPYARMCS